MSTGALDWAFNLTGVTSSQKAVLIALANYADEAGECYPSLRRIAQMTALSERTIRDAIRSLEERGYLVTRDRTREGSTAQTSNRYRIVKTPHPPATAAGGIEEPKKNQLSSEEESARRKPKRPRTLPDGWGPTDEHAAYCRQAGIDLTREAEAFRLDAQAHGRRYIEWNSAFAKWVRSPHPHVMVPGGAPQLSVRERWGL